MAWNSSLDKCGGWGLEATSNPHWYQVGYESLKLRLSNNQVPNYYI